MSITRKGENRNVCFCSATSLALLLFWNNFPSLVLWWAGTYKSISFVVLFLCSFECSSSSCDWIPLSRDTASLFLFHIRDVAQLLLLIPCSSGKYPETTTTVRSKSSISMIWISSWFQNNGFYQEYFCDTDKNVHWFRLVLSQPCIIAYFWIIHGFDSRISKRGSDYEIEKKKISLFFILPFCLNLPLLLIENLIHLTGRPFFFHILKI